MIDIKTEENIDSSELNHAETNKTEDKSEESNRTNSDLNETDSPEEKSSFNSSKAAECNEHANKTHMNDKPEINPSERFREIIKVLMKYKAYSKMTPEKLRLILEDLGPTFVKIGQILSMRQEMLPPQYCKELEKLRTDVEPMSFETVKAVIESEINIPINKAFKSIDETPIGAASIAQVHRAVLAEGDEVVVKVQRPGIHALMEADIQLLLKNTWLISKILKTGDLIDLKAVLKELWHTTQLEMDFLREADNLKRFAANNAEDKNVSCPHEFEKYTTKKLLVMSDVKGIQIDDVEALKNADVDTDDIALKVADSYCRQILDDRFFHADPHPGNIRVNNGIVEWIDLGMVGEISAQLQDILVRAVKAMLKDDMEGVTDAFLMLGEAEEAVDRAKMTEEVGVIVRRYKSAEFDKFDFAALITEFLNLIRRNKIKIPADISLLARSMITMEGTLKIVSPKVNLSKILGNHMKNKKGALREEMKDAGKRIYDYLQTSFKLPENVSKTLEILNDGKLNINITNAKPKDELQIKKKSSVNIILVILIAIFYITSALLCVGGAGYVSDISAIMQSVLEPDAGVAMWHMPVLAIIGFIVGTILFVWLMVRLILFEKDRK